MFRVFNMHRVCDARPVFVANRVFNSPLVLNPSGVLDLQKFVNAHSVAKAESFSMRPHGQVAHAEPLVNAPMP